MNRRHRDRAVEVDGCSDCDVVSQQEFSEEHRGSLTDGGDGVEGVGREIRCAVVGDRDSHGERLTKRDLRRHRSDQSDEVGKRGTSERDRRANCDVVVLVALLDRSVAVALDQQSVRAFWQTIREWKLNERAPWSFGANSE